MGGRSARNCSRMQAMRYSEKEITAACEGPAQQVAIEVVEETGSTNADLMARLQTLQGSTLRVAESQTAGRGRAGRAWHMEPGKTLTFSLAWRFGLPLAQLVGLSLVAGVALAERLTAWKIDARLKWPNDVLKDGGKLAGILVEAAADKRDAHHAWAVVGIGLNLASSAHVAAQIGTPIAAATGLPDDPNAVLAALLNSLAKSLAEFEEQGLPPFITRWNRLHAYADKPVAILENGRIAHEGSAVGVDDTGRLVLDTEHGRIAILSGDLSLRLAEQG